MLHLMPCGTPEWNTLWYVPSVIFKFSIEPIKTSRLLTPALYILKFYHYNNVLQVNVFSILKKIFFTNFNSIKIKEYKF